MEDPWARLSIEYEVARMFCNPFLKNRRATSHSMNPPGLHKFKNSAKVKYSRGSHTGLNTTFS